MSKRRIYFTSICISTIFMLFYEYNYLSVRFQTPAHIKSTGDVQMSVEERITELTYRMTAYLGEIESIGKKVLKDENTQSSAFIIQYNNRTRLFAKSEGYFNQLKAFPFVHTVFFKWDITEMRKYLFPSQYKLISNDCELINDFAKWRDCSTNISGLFKGKKLSDSIIRTGLPDNYTHGSINKTWTFLHVIPNAIVSSNGDVITGNITLTPQRCVSHNTGNIPRDFNQLELYDEVFDVHQYWDQGYYHNTFESLPRMAPYVQFLNDNPKVKILLRGRNPIQSFLDIENIHERRLKDSHFRAKVLYSPGGVPCGKPALLTTQLLSLYAKRDLENNPLKRNKIILIKRSKRRFFKNHNSIAAMLKTQASAHGLELFVFRDDPLPTVEVARRMFNEAIMIVTPHGAGESNMMYAQPGTVIIEGMCFAMNPKKQKVNTCYKLSADILGMRYYGLLFNTGCFDITAEQIKTPTEHLLQHLDILRTTY